MRLLTQAHEFEYRDGAGVDRLGQADVWSSSLGDRAVLVLRGVQDAPPPVELNDAEPSSSGRSDRGEPDEQDAPAGRAELSRLRENGRRALHELEASLLPFLVPRARLNVLLLHRRHRAGKVRALVLN